MQKERAIRHAPYLFFQQTHRMAGHALLGAGEAQALLGGGFNIDAAYIHAHSPGDVFFHLLNMRPQFRALGNHGHIDIADPVARLPYPLGNDLKQLQAVRPLVLGVRVRKVLANVPQSGGTQQSIGHCVKQHIRIGMAQQTQGAY